VILRQLIHDDLGCASYLVGDEHAGVAAVVDPRLDIAEYLRLADYLGVRIAHVLETHNHADHVSGHGALVAATGATIHVHRLAEAEYDHEPFEDGWELALGTVVVRALHTPGHRPEHTAFTLTDTARSAQPWAVLTGDSLFVGALARPDLAVERREGARGIFRSLHDTLLTLPDHCEVWPGHLGGSLCGGPGLDRKVSSTIGYERAAQPLLRETSQEAFVEALVAGVGEQPPNFQAVVARNRGPLEAEPAAVQPLSAAALQEALADGALVVDVRDERAFDAGHIPGSVCIPAVRAGFGSRLGWLAGPQDPVVLVGAGDHDARAAVGLAAAVGLRGVTGWLAGGLDAYDGPRVPLARLTVPELHDRWPGDVQVLDVRDRREFDAGHIPGSIQRRFHEARAVPDELDPAAPLAVICASGQRAAVAASLLQRAGAGQVARVADGGVGTWERAGWPIVRG